jgi:hypothetical protein
VNLLLHPRSEVFSDAHLGAVPVLEGVFELLFLCEGVFAPQITFDFLLLIFTRN